jgi:hypothetical protein
MKRNLHRSTMSAPHVGLRRWDVVRCKLCYQPSAIALAEASLQLSQFREHFIRFFFQTKSTERVTLKE